jgi:hypothetical protein
VPKLASYRKANFSPYFRKYSCNVLKKISYTYLAGPFIQNSFPEKRFQSAKRLLGLAAHIYGLQLVFTKAGIPVFHL